MALWILPGIAAVAGGIRARSSCAKPFQSPASSAFTEMSRTSGIDSTIRRQAAVRVNANSSTGRATNTDVASTMCSFTARVNSK